MLLLFGFSAFLFHWNTMIAYRCLWSVNKAGGKRWSFSSAAKIFYRVTRERFSHYRWIRRFSNYSLHSCASKPVIDFSLCLNLSILCRRIIQAATERSTLFEWMSRVDWMRGNKQAWKEKRKTTNTRKGAGSVHKLHAAPASFSDFNERFSMHQRFPSTCGVSIEIAAVTHGRGPNKHHF